MMERGKGVGGHRRRRHRWGGWDHGALTLSEAALLESSPRLLAAIRPAPAIIATVDPARCNGCGSCLAVCPTEAIELEDFAVVDEDKCTACGTCVVSCPREAILLEDKGRAARGCAR